MSSTLDRQRTVIHSDTDSSVFRRLQIFETREQLGAWGGRLWAASVIDSRVGLVYVLCGWLQDGVVQAGVCADQRAGQHGHIPAGQPCAAAALLAGIYRLRICCL